MLQKYLNLILFAFILSECNTVFSQSDNLGHSEWVFNCSMTVASSDSFSISNEKLLKCKEASIFWSYPQYNMTIKFMASANQDKSFKLCLTDTNYLYKDMPLYRLVDGKETRVDTNPDPICFNNDNGDKKIVTLKSVGPDKLHYYGELINFNIV